MVIKVEGTRSAETLNEVSRDRDDLLEEPLESLVNDIFPNLDMCDWLTRLIKPIPEGRYTTFGSLALALGDAKAARAVGELISSGRVKGPVHRIVYSDGRVPERCMGALSDEMELAHRGSEAYVSRGPGALAFEFEHPPLQSLKRVQTAHRELLRDEKAFRAKRTAGMDISPGKDSHTAVLVLLDLDGHVQNLSRLVERLRQLDPLPSSQQVLGTSRTRRSTPGATRPVRRDGASGSNRVHARWRGPLMAPTSLVRG